MISAAGRMRLLAVGLLFYGAAGAAPAGYAVQQLAEGQSAYRSGRYDDAIKIYSQLVARAPSNARATKGLAGALREVGRYGEAADATRRFLSSVPRSVELSNTLGEILRFTGADEEARRAFARAIEGGASDSLAARLNLAVLRYDRGERDAALREFDRFIDVYNRGAARTSTELSAVGTALRYLGVDNPQLFKDALRAYDAAVQANPEDLEPQVRLGELFLDKYNSSDAQATLEAVLGVNPDHPRALLGMARRTHFDGSPEALELTKRSLRVNPNFVDGRVFLAELYVELEEYDHAAAEAERALGVNPKSLQALATLAAVRYLEGDRAGFEDARRRVLAYNPRYAELYNTLAELSARNRLYHAAVDFAGEAVKLDPKSWRGYGLLGMNQLRIGAIEDGRRNLEIAFDGDPYNVWNKNTLDLLDTFSEYEETRTQRFQLVIHAKESKLLSLYMRNLAEEAYDRLAERYGFEPATPIRVEVFPRHADFSVRTIGLVGLGALGVSFGPVLAMDSPSARQTGEFNWGSTLWHEIAHTFHLGMTDHKVPRWLAEGLAVYEERKARPGWGDDVGPRFLAVYKAGKLLPVSELNNGFMRPAYPEQVAFSYYQASLVCELIESERGFGALTDMLRSYKKGMTTARVFRSILGTDIKDFDRRFEDYLDERFAQPLAAIRPSEPRKPPPRLTREQIERQARRDPDDFAAQLAMGRLLFDAGERDDAERYFRRAKALFPEYAGFDSPYWYLALIYKERGEPRQAAAELATFTGINERHYKAHIELADILESLGDHQGSAEALDRALYIDPFDIAVHARLAELYARIGEPAKVIRERVAVVALDPVDRADALYQLAREYLQAGDLANARKQVLRALEGAPNFEQAQGLLLEIRRQAQGNDGAAR